MESRQLILDKISGLNSSNDTVLPNIPDFPKKDAVLDAFLEQLEIRKGTPCFFKEDAEVQTIVSNLFPDTQIYSATPLFKGNVVVDDEKEIVNMPIDVAIAKSSLAATDGGAIWVNEENLVYPKIFFLALHYVFIINEEDICTDLTLAMKKIDARKHWYSNFISGPSSTADVALTSVFGAQGPQTLHVLIKRK